jgi:hypothetical protein
VAKPFDVRALPGRGFGDVLDEIEPRWDRSPWFTQGGPFVAGFALTRAAILELAEIRSRFAPVLSALRDGTAALVDIEGTVVPPWVWLSGRWRYYRNAEGREKLAAQTTAGQLVEYYNPKFTATAAKEASKEPARSNERAADASPSPIVSRGLELHRMGLNFSRAAAALFEELRPKPTERELLDSWRIDRGRFINTTRTKIRKAYEARRSS